MDLYIACQDGNFEEIKRLFHEEKEIGYKFALICENAHLEIANWMLDNSIENGKIKKN